jgi:hypothetical protein
LPHRGTYDRDANQRQRVDNAIQDSSDTFPAVPTLEPAIMAIAAKYECQREANQKRDYERCQSELGGPPGRMLSGGKEQLGGDQRRVAAVRQRDRNHGDGQTQHDPLRSGRRFP